MLTGEIRNQIDQIWNSFWTGGISNPLEVIEQITYLLFIRRLDELQTVEERRAARTKQLVGRRIFPEGNDPRGRPYEDLRWSRFRHVAAPEMFVVLGEHVFPFLRTLGGDGSTYSHHMRDARFTIPTPALLSRVVDMLDAVPMEDRDTKGDLYEYMLGKIATAGQNGQFRTPRHIIQLMVEMTAPGPKDVIVDPACGTAGFLVAAGEHLRQHHPELLRDEALRTHFHHGMFHGFDFDGTMLRIGSMNMLLHGVENPDIRYRDSLAQNHAEDADRYTLVLANPPFAGALDAETVAKDLTSIVKTRKTELLFLALVLRLLKPGGRAAVIVPDGVLFGSSKAHKELRRYWSRSRSSTAWCRFPRACSALMPACPVPSCCSPGPIAAAPTTCGSTTCTPMAGAWTTSGSRCCPRHSLARSQPNHSTTSRTRRITSPMRSPAGSSVMARKPSVRGRLKVLRCRKPKSRQQGGTCR